MGQTNPSNQTMNMILQIGGVLAAIYYAIGVFLYVQKGISLFGSYPHAMLVTGLVILLISLIIGIYLLHRARQNMTVAPSSILLKKGFLIPFVILSILNIGFTFYLVGKKSANDLPVGLPPVEHPVGKTRIVLLLPLNEFLKPAYEDGIRQVIGFAEFLKDKPECTKGFEFALYDHSMKIEAAESIIKQELAEGTQYFVCTMSKVCLPLSKTFPSLVDSFCHDKTKKPKLICAVTSAPTVNITDGMIYRFYIRSQEEARVLAKLASEKGLNTTTCIAVEDDYGHGAVDEFKKKWKGQSFTEGIFVPPAATLTEIEYQIKQKIKTIPLTKRASIFICHYGAGIDNIITALNNTGIKATILATSTISIYDWQKPIKTILDKTEWYTCIPDYNSQLMTQNDVIKNFTTYALKRLVEAISNHDSLTDFDKSWQTARYPENLEISWDGLDAIIPMKAVYKTEVNHPPFE